MRTLHVDCGREMQGGQWQVLYLVERLGDVELLARGPVLEEAERRGVDVWLFSLAMLLRRTRKFDLVHAHDARAHTMAMIAGGAPLVVSRRVGFPVRSRWKYRRAERLLAVSNFVAARLSDAGIDKSKIRTVHDGVILPAKTSMRETGRVVALASKPVAIPGIQIHLTTNLLDDLQTASVFVYRSEMEGLGSAALAAQAAGVPVVASNAGGLAEAIEHERTGLLVDNDDFEPAIRRLLANPTEAEDMGLRGRERVEKNFTVDLMVERTKAVYQEIVG